MKRSKPADLIGQDDGDDATVSDDGGGLGCPPAHAPRLALHRGAIVEPRPARALATERGGDGDERRRLVIVASATSRHGQLDDSTGGPQAWLVGFGGVGSLAAQRLRRQRQHGRGQPWSVLRDDEGPPIDDDDARAVGTRAQTVVL